MHVRISGPSGDHQSSTPSTWPRLFTEKDLETGGGRNSRLLRSDEQYMPLLVVSNGRCAHEATEAEMA